MPLRSQFHEDDKFQHTAEQRKRRKIFKFSVKHWEGSLIRCGNSGKGVYFCVTTVGKESPPM